MENTLGIPVRTFGHHDVKVSALAMGGHHLGDADDQERRRSAGSGSHRRRNYFFR